MQSRLITKKEGRVVQRQSTLEIKTRVVHNPIEVSEVALQFWASQTPKLVRTYHQGGEYCNSTVDDVTDDLKDWERDHQDDIVKLVALIKRIIDLTKSWGGSSTVRYNLLKDRLVVKKTEKKKILPDDLYAGWTVPTFAKEF